MTKAETIKGCTILLRKNGKHQLEMTDITVRGSIDDKGMSLSLTDEKRNIMLMIPVEPVLDILEVKIK